MKSFLIKSAGEHLKLVIDNNNKSKEKNGMLKEFFCIATRGTNTLPTNFEKI